MSGYIYAIVLISSDSKALTRSAIADDWICNIYTDNDIFIYLINMQSCYRNKYVICGE